MTNINEEDKIRTQDGHVCVELTPEELDAFNIDLTAVLEKHNVGFFPVIVPTKNLNTVTAVINQYKLVKEEVETPEIKEVEETTEETK